MADDEFPQTTTPTHRSWDPAKALEDALSSKQILDKSYEDQTRDILEEAGPAAARSLVNLALYGDANHRLKASTYILDRQLGRVGDTKPDSRSTATDPLEALLGEIVKDAEHYANTHPSSKNMNLNKEL